MMRPACFDIFDLPPGASLEDLKSAYRDLVNVWHPDRWANNPRLQKKAERKLQQLNAAYAEACRMIQSAPSVEYDGAGRGPGDEAGKDEAPGPRKTAADARRPSVRPQAPKGPDPAGPKLWKNTEARLQAMNLNNAWQKNHRGTQKEAECGSFCGDAPASIRRRRIGEVVPERRATPVVTDTPAPETKPRVLWTAAETHLQAIAAAREQERLRAARARDLEQARKTISRLTRRRSGRWRTVLRIAIGLGLTATAGWLIFEYRSVLLGWIAGFPG